MPLFSATINETFGIDNLALSGDYASLNAAVTAIGSAEMTLLVTTALTVSANVTVPETLGLKFIGAGQLTAASGKTVTINGPIEARLRKIFADNVTASFSTNRFIGEIYPQWFGTTGNGSTSDTAAWRKFLAACGGKTGRVLAGTYLLDDTALPASLAGNTHIFGEPGAIIDRSDFNANSTAAIYIESVNDCIIEGLTFTGRNTGAAFNVSNQFNVPIVVAGGNRNKVHHCTFRNLWADAAVYLGSVGSDTSTHSDHNEVSFCTFTRTGVYGPVVIAGSYNKFTHNYCEDCDLGQESNDPAQVLAYNEYTHNTLIGVLRTGSSTYPVAIQTGSRTASDRGNVVDGNTVINGTVVGTAPYTRFTNNLIKSADVAQYYQLPMSWSGSGTAVGYTITGNVYDCSANNIANADARGAVMFDGYTDSSICHNVFIGSPHLPCLEFRANNRITFRGNVLRDGGDYGLYIYGDNSVYDLLIEGNLIIDNALSGLYIRTIADPGNFTYRVHVRNNEIISPASDKQGIPIVWGYTVDSSIEGNVLTPRQNATAITMNGHDTNLRIKDNIGYATEANGTGTINNGATSATITHGLSITPALKNIAITLGENPTNDPGIIWVDTIGSTTFQVNCRADPGASNLDFAWQVNS